MKKKYKLTSGAPFSRCATSNRKKIWLIVFGFFFQIMIHNMTRKFEIFFSKFQHTHEHKQSPRHQQGLIGLI